MTSSQSEWGCSGTHSIHFLPSTSAQLLPVSSQLCHLFPQPLFGSKTYRLGLVLTKYLQRITCSLFPFAHEQIIQEAKVLGLKGPEVGNRDWGSSQNVICHGCWPSTDRQGLGKILPPQLATCQLWSQRSFVAFLIRQRVLKSKAVLPH